MKWSEVDWSLQDAAGDGPEGGERISQSQQDLKITSNSPISTKRGHVASRTDLKVDFILQYGERNVATKSLGAMADHVETSLAGLTVKLVRRATSLAKIYFAPWNMTMWGCDYLER